MYFEFATIMIIYIENELPVSNMSFPPQNIFRKWKRKYAVTLAHLSSIRYTMLTSEVTLLLEWLYCIVFNYTYNLMIIKAKRVFVTNKCKRRFGRMHI